MTTVSLKVLSGGAVQRGLESAANLFEKDTGHKIDLTFATAPAIRHKMATDESSPDVVLAPVPAIDEFTKSGCVIAGSSALIGCVKAGVVVRQGAREPDISTAPAFKQEILDSHSLVYNEGSSGIFVEKLLEQLGVAEQAKAKTVRYPDAEGVMKHLAASQSPKEIGFGQITAILLHAGRGLKLIGPLPREIENITTYAAAVSIRAPAPEVAQQFVGFLVTPIAREAFKTAGVDEPLEASVVSLKFAE